MIYHRHSWMAVFYWIRFALLEGRPFQSLSEVLANHMESPGTKAYTVSEAYALLDAAQFSEVEVQARLCQGDFLQLKLRSRHDTWFNRLAQFITPRPFIRLFGHRLGGMLLITAQKQAQVS